MSRQIRTLLFSSLYPSSVRPGHGIFVETRLRELLRSGSVDTKVVAPVPWYYSTDVRHGVHALMARTPEHELFHGIEVFHPRYFIPPRVGMTIAPFSMALGAISCIRKIQRDGFDFDLIDAHYYYPDGVAAAILASWFRKPFVVTARGTDLNVIPQFVFPRKLMQWTARRASFSIGVCRALVDVLRAWGLPQEDLAVVRNGVDLQRFTPMNQVEARQSLGLTGTPILISVGNLVELKGHHITIEAFASILPEHPTARLVLAGDGPERTSLMALVNHLGVAANVDFAGVLPNDELFRWYSAADIMVLASSREGWANVLLESMACGTPVVASNVGGIPEVVGSPVAGVLVNDRTPGAFAAAVRSLIVNYPDRSLVRAYAQDFSWHASTEAQLTLFRRITMAW